MLPYLLSDHLGLLVDLLPIGHVAHKVMALGPRQSDFLSRFFEALLRSAPQDHLADGRGRLSPGASGKTANIRSTALIKAGCVYGHNILQGLRDSPGDDTIGAVM